MHPKVNCLIIHELIKEQGSSAVGKFISQHAVPIDEKATDLVDRLNGTFFNKENVLNGYFSEEDSYQFPSLFKSAHEKGWGEAAFMSFAKQTIEILKLSLEGVVGARGGYFVYAHYQFEGRDYLGVFLVRDTDGLLFAKKDKRFSIQTITYLNTEKLAMACLVDLAHFKDQKARYLQVVKHAPSQKTISEYFLRWIGLEHSETSASMTERFLELMDHLPLPVNKETGSKLEADQFRTAALKYSTSSPHHSINIHEFDEHFYDGRGVVQNEIRKHELALDTEFRADKKTLKKLDRFSFSDEKIRLTFTKGDYLERRVEVVDNNLVIIRSEQLARQIEEELRQDG